MPSFRNNIKIIPHQQYLNIQMFWLNLLNRNMYFILYETIQDIYGIIIHVCTVTISENSRELKESNPVI